MNLNLVLLLFRVGSTSATRFCQKIGILHSEHVRHHWPERAPQCKMLLVSELTIYVGQQQQLWQQTALFFSSFFLPHHVRSVQKRNDLTTLSRLFNYSRENHQNVETLTDDDDPYIPVSPMPPSPEVLTLLFVMST
jgi:hypothetical protein